MGSCADQRIRGVTDRHYYAIHIQQEIGTLFFYRTTAARSIRFAQFHFHTFDLVYLPLFVPMDGHRVI